MIVLDLSNNSFIGQMPRCLRSMSINLRVLNLQSNWLTGTIPSKFSKCDSLEYLGLSDNQLEGMLPKSLSRCKSLKVISLGDNNFNDSFPSWMEILPHLKVLSLRSNRLHGRMIKSVKGYHPFAKLQIFDLSNNNFGGNLPAGYIQNFNAMSNLNVSSFGKPSYMGDDINYPYNSYSLELGFNNIVLKYEKIIRTMSTLDLSNNSFVGEIPNVIGQLLELRGLNLSHNFLTGHIPSSIGGLTLLDSLDLSSNRLTSNIPQQLVNLTSLGVFNVSNNILEGPIPRGKNFDTFSIDSYEGNVGLCERPLHDCATSHPPPKDNQDASKEDGSILPVWAILIGGLVIGAVIGLFWGYYLYLVRPLWFMRLSRIIESALLNDRDKLE